MILISDYFGKWADHPDATPHVKENASMLVQAVNMLLEDAYEFGLDLPINPKTGTHISGTQYGGFRPQDCPEGAPSSSHKVGRGVDIYDPLNELDNWITDTILERRGLYRESPMVTRGWVHLTDRAPGSGRRTFLP